jgi:hypothetical protein
MNRLAIGAALGGLAVYLYDPELGGRRRDRLSSIWQENRDTALQAGRAASDTIESARPFARRVSSAIGRTDWANALERPRRAATLPRLIGAAALGGVAVYFMDPTKGSQRRMSALAAGRRAVQRVADAVQPLPARVGSHVNDVVVGVKAKVS